MSGKKDTKRKPVAVYLTATERERIEAAMDGEELSACLRRLGLREAKNHEERQKLISA